LQAAFPFEVQCRACFAPAKAGIVKRIGSSSTIRRIETEDDNVKWPAALCLLSVACAQPQTPPPQISSSTAQQQQPSWYPAPGTTSTAVSSTPAVQIPYPPPVTPRDPGATTTAPPQQRPAPQANITIEAVEVGNPLTISGRARTFENNVALRVRDAKGVLISESFTTATGEMGQHSPYRGTLWLTRDPGYSVTVEALEYSAKDGSEQSVVRVQRPFNVELVDVQLAFPDSTCERVKPFTRRIPKSMSAARVALEALMAGPTAQEKAAGAVAPFPKGSRVESVNLRNRAITVDFNERLQNVGGSCRANMIRASVNETLRRLPGVDSVTITAAGSEQLALQP
jgi:hypothetical protein